MKFLPADAGSIGHVVEAAVVEAAVVDAAVVDAASVPMVTFSSAARLSSGVSGHRSPEPSSPPSARWHEGRTADRKIGRLARRTSLASLHLRRI
ncbi:MAG: hypothetical protein KDA62_15400 [Planctomycetales bacterium]|nr:hypothetical protein [Planctomycetales bacterium]